MVTPETRKRKASFRWGRGEESETFLAWALAQGGVHGSWACQEAVYPRKRRPRGWPSTFVTRATTDRSSQTTPGHHLALRVATVEGSLELLSPTTQPSSNLDPRATAVKITQRPEKTGSYLFQGLITVFFWCLTSVSCYLIEGKDAPTPWLSYSPTPCVSPVPGMTVDHLTLLGLRLCLRAALPSRVGIDPDRAVRTREPRPEAEGPGG